MLAEEVFALGLGLTPPWTVMSQSLETETSPSELHLEIGAERGALYPCPKCQSLCKAHDFKEYTWRHLNFFQHHCYLTARMPRVKCPEHGIRRFGVPWAREMPINAVARHVEVTDNRLWRIVRHYVGVAMDELELADLKAVGLDETSSKRRHNYITVFIDLDREEKPVIFATPGKGKECLRAFCEFIEAHGGHPDKVEQVVCDMSPAFISAVGKELPSARVTVDWFHVVQLFTSAVDEVRRLEGKDRKMPSGTRWAVLKAQESARNTMQEDALQELLDRGFATAQAFRVKEPLRWVRRAETEQAAKWRATSFVRHAREYLEKSDLLGPVKKALATFERHLPRILHPWNSRHSNARLEGLNGLFQPARARARGYRNVANFITMVYLIAAPIQVVVTS